MLGVTHSVWEPPSMTQVPFCSQIAETGGTLYGPEVDIGKKRTRFDKIVQKYPAYSGKIHNILNSIPFLLQIAVSVPIFSQLLTPCMDVFSVGISSRAIEFIFIDCAHGP